MKGFGIYVKNDLLDPKHIDGMRAAIWMYLWLLDKMTSISEEGIGKVLGGKPISYADDFKPEMGVSERTYFNWLKTLKDAGYIETTRTNTGTIISVKKAVKVWKNDNKSAGTVIGKRRMLQREVQNVAPTYIDNTGDNNKDKKNSYTQPKTRTPEEQARINKSLASVRKVVKEKI